jgi:hypothetical protein
VEGGAPSNRDLDAVRTEADRFLAERDEEEYLHYAGHKATLDLAPIYERHAVLAELDTARTVAAAVDGDSRVRELWRFTCETYLGGLTREHEERAARLEADLVAEVDGEEIPFRMLRPAMANEPDRDRRRRLDHARVELGEEHLNPVRIEAATAIREGVRDLGAPTYLELYRDRFGMELERLAGQCRSVLDATESLYEEVADRLLRERVGVGLDEAARWDISRVFRAPQWDDQFPAARMVAALEATLGDLGVDLRGQRNVELDIEQRPLKSPRAFCAPIEVPGRIVLVIQPTGGVDDWRSLFHEAGHTEHFAHTSADLPVEERRLGDNAVTEGWAALFGLLVDEPAWLGRRLDVPRAPELAREGAVEQLFFLRRYAAKLLYELELHAAGDVTAMRGRYVELLEDALKIEPSGSDWLADVDPGFYASCYLRSWAVEAQLRDRLREEFGNAWFARREAGDLLRELWSLGQGPTAEELVRDVTGGGLELDAVTDRIRERLG